MLGAEDGVYKLARLGYYKYRAANLMFGFNTHVTSRLALTPHKKRRKEVICHGWNT